MKRQIIKIDEQKCTGCGLCIPGCPEGALQIIDGKARLVGDFLCDGLGACIGTCPEGAITVQEREAEAYDEMTVLKNIIEKGPNTIKAHLQHLSDHNQKEYMQQAVVYLAEHNIDIPELEGNDEGHHHSCPGSKNFTFETKSQPSTASVEMQPALSHWPVQLHLASPTAQHYHKSDLLLAADCTAFSMGNFNNYLEGKSLAIACPKLDTGIESYIEKLTIMIDESELNTITVMMMQVPCCGGLLQMVQTAMQKANRTIPIKALIVSVQGEILREEWVM